MSNVRKDPYALVGWNQVSPWLNSLCEQLEVEQQHEPKPLSKQTQWRRRMDPDLSAVFSV